MTVVCPGCGRSYSPSLFTAGRAIDCRCGARVGPETPRRAVTRDGEPRFLCDAMLGRLARWLRALGYDAEYDPAIEDAALAERAFGETRAVLTRDRSFPDQWRIGGCLVVESEEAAGQLIEVVDRFALEPPLRMFSRCLECNHELRPATDSEVARNVPEPVRRRHDNFTYCASCDRVYWEGSHVRRMRRRLEEALDVP